MSASDKAAWENLFFVTYFGMSDTLGRFLGGFKALLLPRKAIIAMCYLRTIFLGLFLLVDFQVSPISVFGSDWFKLIIILLFGMLNGFGAT